MCFFRKTLLSVCIVLPCAALAQPVAVEDNASTNEDTQIVFNILSNDDATPNAIDPLSVDLDPSSPLDEEKLISIAEGDFAVDNAGLVTFMPALNFNGDAIISYTVKNDEGTPQTSDPVTITVTVMPINDSPSFTNGGDQTVNEDAGPQTVLTWATNIMDGDDGSQGLTFDVSNDNMALFTPGGQPSITSEGDLSYEPAANASGSATVSVVLTDDGGDEPPNVDTSVLETFEITVDPLNDAPVFTPGTDVAIYENAGPQTISAWATGIDDGDPESDQGLSFNVGNNNNALFLVQPAISELTGDLTFETAADAFGMVTVTVTLVDDGLEVAPDVNTSISQMFDITVNPINNAPSFTKGPDESILEDAGPQTVVNWATNIMDGDDGTQDLLFVVDNDNGALFSTPPSITPDGDLSYEVAANASGSAVVTVKLTDDGVDVLPSVNESAEQTFNITVGPVNDAPVFIAGSNVSVYGSAPQTVNGWAIAIDDGDPESDQGLSFTLITDNNALFLVQPAISELTGDLTFTPAASANGSATVMVTLVDGGSNVPPDVNSSAPLDFTITIDAVNDPPTFTAGPNQTVDEDDGAQTVLSWATGIDDGDAGVSQVLTFDVTNDNNGLFSTQPAIDELTGTLTYTPEANAYGSATVAVILRDDGADTPAPNNNTSASQEFAITINPINDAPVFVKGMDQVIDEDAGPQTVPGWATGIDDGDAGVSQMLTFAVTNDNNTLFSTQPAIDATTGTLTYRPADNVNGSATVSVILSDDGADVAPNTNSSEEQTFFINVNAIDDTPTIESLMNQTIDENTETGPLEVTIGDAETPPNLLTLTPMSSNTGLVDNTGLVLGGIGSMRSVNVIPKLNEFGMAIITLTVTDEGGNSAATEFQVFVNEVDVAPTISPINDQVINEDTSTGALQFSVADVDTGLGSLMITASSNNQLLIPDGNISIVADGGGGADWTIEVSPLPNTNSPALGVAIITIEVSDGVGRIYSYRQCGQ
jgi:hypothetical protein